MAHQGRIIEEKALARLFHGSRLQDCSR